MFENHVMQQKKNNIYKSKAHSVFFQSHKSIGWVGSMAGREVNGHRARMQGPVHEPVCTRMYPCDKWAVLGTTRRGQRQQGQM